MGSTSVTWKGRTFAATDAEVGIWLELLVKEIQAMNHAPAWLRDAADEWHLQATAGFGFGVTPGLDRVVTDDERRDIVLGISRRALEQLDTWSDPVSRDLLNDSGVGGPDTYYYADLPLDGFRRVGRSFIGLLEEGRA
jgi:hypothetical protein